MADASGTGLEPHPSLGGRESEDVHPTPQPEAVGVAMPEPGHPERNAVSSGAPTVHIVDDDEAVRCAVGLLVQSRGWIAATYASAEEFLDRFERGPPACLIIDLHMPGMSGPDLQSVLRRRAPDLPVIVATALPEHPLADRSRELGAAAVLAKPFRDRELCDRVAACLEADALPAAWPPGRVRAT